MNYKHLLLVIIGFLFLSKQSNAQNECPEAQKYIDKRKAEEQKGKTIINAPLECYSDWAKYYVLKCQCEKGVASKEAAKKLADKVNANRKYLIRLKKTECNLGEGVPEPVTSCKVNGDSNNPNKNQTQTIDYDKGRIVKDEYLNLLNDLSDETNNPRFKNMVEEMNDNRNSFAQGRGIAQKFGYVNQDDMDAYNTFENIAQGAALIKFLYNEATGKLTPEQEQARKIIMKVFVELNEVHQEVSFVPTNYINSGNTLEKIEKTRDQIDRYERATALKRLLYLDYWRMNPYPTMNQLESRYQELQNIYNANGASSLLSEIEWKQEAFTDPIFNPIVNKEQGFSHTINRLKLLEANYYEKNGDKKKAEQIRATIDYDVSNFEAFRMSDETYAEKDYFSCLQYYEQVKQVIDANEVGKHFFLFYSEVPSTIYNWDGLWRHEATYILSLGVLSNVRTGNIQQAKQELSYLKQYNTNLANFTEEYKNVKMRKKAGKFSDADYQKNYDISLSIERATEAAILAKEEKLDSALLKINKAIELSKIHPQSTLYDYWFNIIKLELLVDENAFRDAKKQAIEMKNLLYFTAENKPKQYDGVAYKFALALMKYKQKQYTSCINQLKILKGAYPGSQRVQLLLRDAYIANGDIEKAQHLEESMIKN